MFRLSTRLIIVLITFLIGIFSVAGWLYYQESQKNQLILPNARWEQIYFNGVERGRDGINQVTKLAGLEELRKLRLKAGDIENKFSPQQAAGVLKEFELTIFICHPLLFDIVLYHFFRAMRADAADEIAV